MFLFSFRFCLRHGHRSFNCSKQFFVCWSRKPLWLLKNLEPSLWPTSSKHLRRYHLCSLVFSLLLSACLNLILPLSLKFFFITSFENPFLKMISSWIHIILNSSKNIMRKIHLQQRKVSFPKNNFSRVENMPYKTTIIKVFFPLDLFQTYLMIQFRVLVYQELTSFWKFHFLFGSNV